MSPAFMRALTVFVCGFGLAACHKGPVEYPAVPPLTVRPEPPAGPFDYTVKDTRLSGRVLKKRIAVARFEDNIPVSESPFGRRRQVDIVAGRTHVRSEEILPDTKEVGWEFSEKLTHALAQTNRFVVLERKDIHSMLREVSFAGTKWADADKGAREGKIVGAQIIVTGLLSLNDGNDRSEERPLALHLRMYDVETSRIVGTARATGRTESELVDKAVEEIVINMETVPWSGKIASISGDRVYLNAGSLDGVRAGDRFDVFSLGREIRDPDTNEVIGFEEAKAARAEVTEVAPRAATLRVTDVTRPLNAGDSVKPDFQ